MVVVDVVAAAAATAASVVADGVEHGWGVGVGNTAARTRVAAI